MPRKPKLSDIPIGEEGWTQIYAVGWQSAAHTRLLHLLKTSSIGVPVGDIQHMMCIYMNKKLKDANLPFRIFTSDYVEGKRGGLWPEQRLYMYRIEV